jgi:hypothetical protein
MILSHKHKLIFIHIGKTGGTSIEDALCQLLDLNWEDTKYHKDVLNNIGKLNYTPWWIRGRDYAGRINCKHITASDLKHIVGDEIWNEYFKISFVRNPYDKLLSEYSMFTQFEEFKDHPWNKYATYQDFLKAVFHGKERIGSNPYHHFLTDQKGDLLVDFYGKFETLQKDFDKICEMLGLNKMQLPNKRPTKHKSYESYYSPDAMEMVYRINKKDFQLLKYPKQIDGLNHIDYTQRLLIAFRYYYLYRYQSFKSSVKSRLIKMGLKH